MKKIAFSILIVTILTVVYFAIIKEESTPEKSVGTFVEECISQGKVVLSQDDDKISDKQYVVYMNNNYVRMNDISKETDILIIEVGKKYSETSYQVCFNEGKPYIDTFESDLTLSNLADYKVVCFENKAVLLLQDDDYANCYLFPINSLNSAVSTKVEDYDNPFDKDGNVRILLYGDLSAYDGYHSYNASMTFWRGGCPFWANNQLSYDGLLLQDIETFRSEHIYNGEREYNLKNIQQDIDVLMQYFDAYN